MSQKFTWAIKSMQATEPDSDDSFVLTLVLTRMGSYERHEFRIGMTIELLRQFIIDLVELEHSLEIVKLKEIADNNGSDPHEEPFP